MKIQMNMTLIASIRRSLLITGFLIAGTCLFGQYSNVMYYMQSVPQAHFLNPARQPLCNFYFGIPAASSVFVNYGNNSFDVYDLIFPGSGPQSDSLITILHPSYDIGEFIDKLKISNLQSADASVSLFSLGFRAKNSYITIDLSTKTTARIAVPRDLMAIVLQGNGEFIGKEADFSPLRLNASAYHEFGIGISRRLTRHFYFGFRPKLLLGVANVTTANPVPDIGLYTDPDNFDLNFHSQLTLNVSAPIDVTYTSEGEIDNVEFRDIPDNEIVNTILNVKNPGMGLDLGMEYKLTDKVALSASLLDLGFIRWGSNTYNFKQNGEFLFTGFDLSDGLVEDSDWEFEDEAESLLDSIKTLFNVDDEAEAYFTFLAPKLYLGASYDLNNTLRLGFLSRTEFFGARLRQSLSLSANLFLAKFLNLSASYNILNGTYDNLGAGFALKLGPLHVYTVIDKVPVRWTKIEATTDDFDELNGLIIPSKLNSINARIGLNFMFGCRQKRMNDKPLVF